MGIEIQQFKSCNTFVRIKRKKGKDEEIKKVNPFHGLYRLNGIQ